MVPFSLISSEIPISSLNRPLIFKSISMSSHCFVPSLKHPLHPPFVNLFPSLSVLSSYAYARQITMYSINKISYILYKISYIYFVLLFIRDLFYSSPPKSVPSFIGPCPSLSIISPLLYPPHIPLPILFLTVAFLPIPVVVPSPLSLLPLIPFPLHLP